MFKTMKLIWIWFSCFILFSFTIGFIFSSYVHAIEIDTLINVTDQKGKATFSITNTQDKRLFLNVGMSKVTVVDGEIVKIPYVRENIEDWEIDVRPARTIIDVGQTKDFEVTMRCKDKCANDKDQFYQVAFVPTPYFDGESKPEKSVKMAIGFGATLINPAHDQPIKYNAKYNYDEVIVENVGGTYLKGRLNACDESNDKASTTSSCIKAFNLLPERTMTIKLPDIMQKPYVDLTLSTNMKEFSESERLYK